MRYANAIVLALLCSSAGADNWTGPDKTKHAIGGAGIAAAAALALKSGDAGCAAASAVGLGKELYDATGRGTPSIKDFIVTAAAGCAVAYSAEWLFIVPSDSGARIVWTKRF